MSKYLTIKDYIKATIKFFFWWLCLSIFFSIAGKSPEYTVEEAQQYGSILGFVISIIISFVSLWLTSNTNKKESQMIWQAGQDLNAVVKTEISNQQTNSEQNTRNNR